MAGPIPMLTDKDKALIKQLHETGRKVAYLATKFKVSTTTIRRVLFPDKYQARKKQRAPREFAINANDSREPALRISDYHDHLILRLINEGPTPERRRLMEEGRI